ncbi:response regulator transcription factor [Clostridium botulinum]|uniref:response regulator transcription factor n=1 Tax=Clostridium botulinum TaxID=1491 RepID=UPI0007E00CE7|nr:response regulator transcription factor [Clostridium botulinum]KEI91369.1 transcriptional regulator [Clostridium botulinum B2 275]NEZ73894.1 response regulator transcription factor [Clostridium botulinum]NEZ98623.1 response regulator transcription factor [Clostridium botulinum]NFA29819.1 response regulator transcription factor [Clostridium botulinum]NFA84188.1 response regulator transcription factor [Clostridium botulinum]
MKRNLLVVEDDPKIRRLLIVYFRDGGFNILEAETGEDAIRIFKNEKIDLVFLDIMLPEADGLRVCEVIRETSDVPIIMLTAKSQEEDKLRGFEYGADEYVTKPFSLKVLAARAHAMMKRVDGKVSKKGCVFKSNGLTVDLASGEVKINEVPVILTQKEIDLLILLIHNKGIVLSKEQILDKVWGFDYDGDPRTVDTHIKRLRHKLKDKNTLIKTVRGRGYCFDIDSTIPKN